MIKVWVQEPILEGTSGLASLNLTPALTARSRVGVEVAVAVAFKFEVRAGEL